MNQLLKNWKTTSAGISVLVASLTGLWFKRMALDETTVVAGVTGILTGLGLMFGADGGAQPPTGGLAK